MVGGSLRELRVLPPIKLVPKGQSKIDNPEKLAT
jgi:hypothetical protein